MHAEDAPQAEITYFVQDAKKTGGTYETARGKITKYNALSCSVKLDTGVTVSINDIVDVKADCFND